MRVCKGLSCEQGHKLCQNPDRCEDPRCEEFLDDLWIGLIRFLVVIAACALTTLVLILFGATDAK